MRSKMLLCLVAIAGFYPVTLRGQSGFLKNISVRKTFDGTSKDEAKPASFFYTRDLKNKNDVYTADIGLKLAKWELLPNKNTILTLLPTVEYHTNKVDTFTVNNVSAGLNVQWQLWPLKDTTGTPHHNVARVASEDNSEVPGHKVAPWILASSSVQRDFVKQTSLAKAKGYLSAISKEWLSPSVAITKKDHKFFLRYYPYVGYEYYSGLKKEKTSSSSYFTERVYFEFWPGLTKIVGKLPKRVLQLTFDFSLRQKIHDEYYKVNSTHYLDVGLNYYLLGNDKLGIGLEYSEGFDPGSNFANLKKIALGLKLKL